MLTPVGRSPSVGATPLPATSVSYLVIGHVAKDLTPSGPHLGGTAAYASLTAQALGYPAGLVTACADDVDLSPLSRLGVAATPSASSTTFENCYRPEGRQQYLRARADSLTRASVPARWLSAPIVHVGPIAGEVPADLVMRLVATGRFLGLTPQGWMRRWTSDGRVSPADWTDSTLLLPLASAVVLSIEDLRGDWAIARRWAEAARMVVVTQGALGCTVFARGQPEKHVPAPEVSEVEPTGAGDVFAAAFFIRLHETQSPYESAQFANRAAATSVTRLGLAGIPTPDEAKQLRVDHVWPAPDGPAGQPNRPQ
jgi:sugar/nucleoside kinase (ribokinase family)